ncbi:hypothetical protein NDU88_011618 [Pleurodeles waltl]|uniref:Uncharacterized protein n=1 Tax=Pleurodeles waltl TaxID=8319 RepID=A0AAV7S1P0_PLEWA|nr:hypothetical protein NDU88_011618 [Pleurodeles waltl]
MADASFQSFVETLINPVNILPGAGGAILKLRSRVGRRDHRIERKSCRDESRRRDPARVWTRARLDQSYEAQAALGTGPQEEEECWRAPRTGTDADPTLEGPGGLGLEDPPLRVRDRLAVALTIGGWKAVPLPDTAQAYPRGQTAY